MVRYSRFFKDGYELDAIMRACVVTGVGIALEPGVLKEQPGKGIKIWIEGDAAQMVKFSVVHRGFTSEVIRQRERHLPLRTKIKRFLINLKRKIL